MAVERENLGVKAFAIAATFFIALAISIRFLKEYLMNPKRKKLCYLNAELKPQYAFKRVLADNSYSQFKHLKLHSADSHSDEDYLNLHPYKGEISKLMKNPDVDFFECLDGCEKGSLEMGSSYLWVETEAQLRELVEVLSNERVFAVDTEQHSYRSFLGFTALVQVRISISANTLCAIYTRVRLSCIVFLYVCALRTRLLARLIVEEHVFGKCSLLAVP